MTTNDRTKKAEPADVRFAVTITDSKHYAGMTRYRHFTARAYILAPDRYATRTANAHTNELHSPDSYSIEAGPARVLAGLAFTAQADDDSMQPPAGDEWYSWEASYDRTVVKLRDAEEILPVLRKIDKRMARLTSELGRPANLAQFCAYAASAITSQRSPFLRSVPEGQDWEGTGYRAMDADALSYHLMSDASEWREAHGYGKS